MYAKNIRNEVKKPTLSFCSLTNDTMEISLFSSGKKTHLITEN